ncbi:MULTISPECIES: Nif11-like leader peptide family natural product precursor [Thermomonosporaceae]|uniref:Nif11-like leader peptide family natural product precursor n=1 Tax=Thermomonosporaceae TaxID=2012 RepID=UPI00255ABB06|nr:MULTISPECIES: Nif11-like leader peptide family natural product precursor [Thermomonosporaceae]MDL4773542.1 Nif11-like leader peptide family natural product precursor [Actinomadura xylanilytica]
MSVESCAAFLRVALRDTRFRQQMKAMTAVAEMIRLGRAHGYLFDERDLAVASSSPDLAEAAPVVRSAPSETGPTAFYHHEYDMDQIPGFAAVIDQLPALKIKPSTVDLARFDEGFRAEDLRSTSMVPGGREHRRWRAGLGAQAGPRDRRDFHLVNLDEHVEHEEYDAYYAAKTRLVDALEKVFGGEVRLSGSMWYPPSSYRLWHTNEEQPGWRMYLIDFDEDFADPEQTSFFRYQHPETRELVTLSERPRMARFFKVEQDPDRLFWHCIVNPTQRHRWSFGCNVPDTWFDDIAGRS